ncbi:siphovirus ReqiPepy6 Gp37-like family protein [Actinomadura decatromicini]|uniref:Gp28/Gp37-like domain-containing protein n=1 Tax=Actinomadura decatromicini TaxID=2604572 RepID=A0A5D3FA03_9ACTN|nr:siphovirus ReqiPepy6 Gp37-like family protein [Actinomadura decatromicini]TYK45151.1 hypothetical protein FXF68_31210 [Actinomadura decatromicini]
MAVTVLITDQNLNVQGYPIDGWTSLDVTRKFNEPASGTVVLPARPEVLAQIVEGNRLRVIRDGQVWCAGPMEVPREIEMGYGGGEGSAEPQPGKVTINFTDDLGRIAGYFTWPNPAVAWTLQPISTWRQITATNAEVIIRTLVDESCGPSALAARRIPSFGLGALASVGTTTSVQTRFEGLLDVCRRVAIDGDGLGFRTREDADQIVFEVYGPSDLTATARFSFGLGNLRYLRAKISAPTVTHALIAGTEDDTTGARTFVEVADSAAASNWYRVEKFVDGSAANDTNGELTQAGNEEIAGGAAPVELATVTVDVPDRPGQPGMIAGRDFDLGDRVTVALPTGLEVADLVRSIHLQATPKGGEYVTSLIGSSEATTDLQTVKLVRELGRRLGRLAAR